MIAFCLPLHDAKTIPSQSAGGLRAGAGEAEALNEALNIEIDRIYPTRGVLLKRSRRRISNESVDVVAVSKDSAPTELPENLALATVGCAGTAICQLVFYDESRRRYRIG